MYIRQILIEKKKWNFLKNTFSDLYDTFSDLYDTDAKFEFVMQSIVDEPRLI